MWPKYKLQNRLVEKEKVFGKELEKTDEERDLLTKHDVATVKSLQNQERSRENKTKKKKVDVPSKNIKTSTTSKPSRSVVDFQEESKVAYETNEVLPVKSFLYLTNPLANEAQKKASRLLELENLLYAENQEETNSTTSNQKLKPCIFWLY